MTDDGPTLTPDDVEGLTTLIESGLASLGDPAVRIIPVAEYAEEARRGADGCHVLSVDIDVGTTVLTLRLRPSLPRPDPRAELGAWADLIVKHVFHALGDHAGVARLRAGEKTLQGKIRRERSDLELLSLRPAPAWIHEPAPLGERPLRARVRMLDDALQLRIVELQGTRRAGSAVTSSAARPISAHDGRRRTIYSARERHSRSIGRPSMPSSRQGAASPRSRTSCWPEGTPMAASAAWSCTPNPSAST